MSEQDRLRFPYVSIQCICGSYHACCVHSAKVLLFLSGDTLVPQSDLAWCAAVLVTWGDRLTGMPHAMFALAQFYYEARR